MLAQLLYRLQELKDVNNTVESKADDIFTCHYGYLFQERQRRIKSPISLDVENLKMVAEILTKKYMKTVLRTCYLMPSSHST